MRIYVRLTEPNGHVPFDYMPKVVGALHKWIGKNEEHGNVSLYSLSMLTGGEMANGALAFPNGATLFISAHDPALVKKTIDGIKNSPDMAFGMKVHEIIMKEYDRREGNDEFLVASPVLIKRTEEKNLKFYTYKDEETGKLLTETLKHKMKLAGLPEDETLAIGFNKDYARAKTKLVSYRGIKNKANVCPVIIKGKPETKEFTWNVGVGNSTGIGFGALK